MSITPGLTSTIVSPGRTRPPFAMAMGCRLGLAASHRRWCRPRPTRKGKGGAIGRQWHMGGIQLERVATSPPCPPHATKVMPATTRYLAWSPKRHTKTPSTTTCTGPCYRRSCGITHALRRRGYEMGRRTTSAPS